MTTHSSILIALLVIVPLVGRLSAANAEQPNLSDIASCNEEAQAKAGSPSGSPSVPPALPPGPSTRQPAQPGPSADAPRLTPKPGTQTDPSGSIVVQSPDPLIVGMATEGLSDRAYRTAYRDCMGARLKPKR